MRSRTFWIVIACILCINFHPTLAFNSNLPPPWLVRTATINPIPTESATKSNPTKKSSKSSSNEKVPVEPSSNSGAPASTDQKPTNSAVTRSMEGNFESKSNQVDSSSNEADEKVDSSVSPAVNSNLGTSLRTHKGIPSTRAFGIHGNNLKTPEMAPLVQSQKKVVGPSVKPHLPSLLKMCRLSNIPGVILFHVVGTYIAVDTSEPTAILKALCQPSMLAVFASLLILSCSSMVINDYYDARTGVDILNSSKALPAPAPVIKRFLSYQYTTLLTTLVFLPGKIARMSVVFGSLLTFWYTQHLKPKTWLKNVSCAGLVALSPFTSAAAASYIQGTPMTKVMGKILQLSTTLFLGMMGREIWMDILDEQGDREASIQTIPVKYGKRIACRITFALSIAMALISNTGHLLHVMNGESAWRNFIFGSLASSVILTRATQIMRKDGMNRNVIHKAVEEGKIVIFFILASFI